MFARGALLSTILLVSAAAFAAASPPGEPVRPAATILCYHIVETPAAQRMQIGRDAFRQHIRYLEMTGYNVIPLHDLYEYITGTRDALPANAVVITFDDGWRSTYTEAFPELRKRGFPFTIFIYPNIIGKTANALSWKMIREMAAAGVDVESHSLSHGYMTKRHHAAMGDDQYAAWLQTELVESKRILEKASGQKVEFFAYPYGDYDTNVARAAAKAGYTAAFTCNFGRVKRGSDLMHLRRFVIDDTMDFASFRKYLGATPLRLAEMTPKPGSPADPGATIISAKIPGFQKVDPKSVGMALLNLGVVEPFSYDAQNGEVMLALNEAISSLKSKVNRAIVWATDVKTGKRVEATWVFGTPGSTTPPAPAPPLPAVTPGPATASTTPAPTGPR